MQTAVSASYHATIKVATDERAKQTDEGTVLYGLLKASFCCLEGPDTGYVCYQTFSNEQRPADIRTLIETGTCLLEHVVKPRLNRQKSLCIYHVTCP